jgi:outer membrane murein-binding lipoprotein Lpp
LGLACICDAASVSQQSKVTPVEKVIELLKSLQEQTAAEGKKEAAAYDKYACFCKEQADEKLYMIEKSEKKIAKLDAKIKQLESDISELNAAINDLAAEIDELTHKIDTAQEERNHEHEEYKIVDADTVAAIGAMEGAIKALKDSKAAMDDGAKVDLIQVQAAASKVLAVATKAKRMNVPQTQLNKIAALAEINQAPPAYEYRSNDIIQTLEDLKDTFLQNKKEDDEAEFSLNSAWEKKDLNLKNLRKFSEEAKFQKEQFVEAKTETKETAEADATQENKDKNADNDFMQLLTEECQGKATQWDQRSSTRAGELTALAGAIESLEADVAPSFKANKKLAQLQLRASPKEIHGHWAWVQEEAPAKQPTSFLQLRGSQTLSQTAVLNKATAFLTAAAGRIGSSLLESAAIRVDASADHFVKVRQIIKDLVSKLEADAEAEASHKSFCDNAIGENVAARDAAVANVEGFTTQKSSLEAEDAKLNKEIAELAADIASLKKGLKEATELRASERKENEDTIDTAEQGHAGVELALKILSEFYATAFIQYVPPNSGRDGKTVGDMAPDTFEGDYHGNQEKSKGIIGLLEVIESDFARTIQTVNDEEIAAQDEFNAFKEQTEADIADKTEAKEHREDRRAEIKDELASTIDSLKEENALLASAKKALEELESQCIRGEETYEERVAKRTKEIEALKEAQNILENWKGF